MLQAQALPELTHWEAELPSPAVGRVGISFCTESRSEAEDFFKVTVLGNRRDDPIASICLLSRGLTPPTGLGLPHEPH